MKIKTGDTVIIRSGKDKGRKGKVIKTFLKKGMVVVEGMNIKKRHQRPTRQNQHGQIVEKALPLHVSNVAVIDPKTNTPTRVGYKEEKGKKVRVARKSGAVISE